MTLKPALSFQRALALGLILGSHLLLLLYWQSARQHNVASLPNSVMTMLLLAAPHPVREPAPSVPVPIKKTARPRASEPPVAPFHPDRAGAAAALPKAISVPATPIDGAPTSDLAGASLRAVGDIDKAFRSQLRRLPGGDLPSTRSSLASAIAAAGINHNLAPTLRQRTLSDGRTIVQVSSAAGTYCVTQQSAGATDGRDHLQNGNAALVTSCGNLFD